MYGNHTVPTEIMKDDLRITLTGDRGYFTYHRELCDDIVEKNIMADKGNIVICPIEPLNLPKKLSSSLLIEFEKPIVIGPGYKKRVFLTFPVEIGVFIGEDRQTKPLDIFSFGKKKFTLYGDVKTGLICKYWKSNIYEKPPRPEPHYEGILELMLTNSSKKWVEVTKTVLNAYNMKMYYDSSRVSMRARMNIIGEDISETSFLDKPVGKGMKPSREVYTQVKQTLKGHKFIMEGGF